MSRKITLLKAAQVPLRGPIRPSGTTITVDDETFQSLSARGLIAGDGQKDSEESGGQEAGSKPEEPEVTGDADAEDESAEDADQEPADDPERPSTTSSGDLPPMTAPLAVWREFAESPAVGIKTTGMKKPEIIGAVKAHLNK